MAVFTGLSHASAGRRGEQAVPQLTAARLQSLGLQTGRLKTGTPPRLLRASLDFSRMTLQQADNLEFLFEFTPHKMINTRDCYITYTNPETTV